MLKLKKLSLLFFVVAAFLFTACEADFPMEELDEQLKQGKPWATILCPAEDGDTAI